MIVSLTGKVISFGIGLLTETFTAVVIAAVTAAESLPVSHAMTVRAGSMIDLSDTGMSDTGISADGLASVAPNMRADTKGVSELIPVLRPSV